MSGKPGRGRISKLTPELQDEVCKLLRAGNYGEVAAEYVGIHRGTYFEWKQRGADDQQAGKASIYADFADAVKKAEGHAEARAVAIIQQAMPQNWAAAMTYLERKFPQRWGRRERLEHSGNLKIAIDVPWLNSKAP